jgi:hypothetical protein
MLLISVINLQLNSTDTLKLVCILFQCKTLQYVLQILTTNFTCLVDEWLSEFIDLRNVSF